MKLFLSHSWRDKTFADRLVNDLDGVADIWFDSRKTKPGEFIDASVREGLDETDVVVCVWSGDANDSNWVNHETQYALDCGIPVLVCRLDDTPLPVGWSQLVAIDFRDLAASYGNGFTRLNIAIFKLGSAQLGLDNHALEDALNDYDGVLNYVNDYRTENDISGEGVYWMERIVESTQRAHGLGVAFQDDLEGFADEVRDIAEAMQYAWDDLRALDALRTRVKELREVSPALDDGLSAMLESRIKELSGSDKPIKRSKQKKATRKAEIAKAIQAQVEPDGLNAAVKSVYHYIKSANDSLETLRYISMNDGSAAGADICQRFQRRFEIDRAKSVGTTEGYFCRAESAWLIHNVIYRLAMAGFVHADMFPVDWERIAIADHILRRVLPPRVQGQLEESVIECLDAVQHESLIYQSAAPANDTDRWMNVLSESLGLA
ncbi:MAG: toll/interleukin-1 receptor domain-containing protein [Pseudomonadota bacterium]